MTQMHADGPAAAMLFLALCRGIGSTSLAAPVAPIPFACFARIRCLSALDLACFAACRTGLWLCGEWSAAQSNCIIAARVEADSSVS